MEQPYPLPSELDQDAQAALRERTFSQAAADSLPGTFYVFTREGRFLRWNQNLELVSGYSAAELALMSPLGLFHETKREVVQAAIDAAFRDGSATLECDILSKQGTTTPYFFTGKVFDFGGKPCLVGMGLDVSERQRAATDLRERDELLRRIIEESPLSMAIVCMDGTIEYFNGRAMQTFGYLPDDIPTMERWFALAYPDGVYRAEVITRWMGLVEKAIATGTEIPRGEYAVTCKNGTVKTMVIFGAVVRDKVFVMFEDISERKRVEAHALREREQNLSALAENANDGILIVGADGDHRYANRRAAELSGYSIAELLQLNIRQLAPSDDVDGIAEPLHPAASGSRLDHAAETRIVTKAGTAVPVEITAALTVWNGQPANLLVMRDIGERKRAEEEREKLHAQLAQAHKMEAIGTLAGGVAHDFNNILGCLLGGLSLLDVELGAASALHQDILEMKAQVQRGADLAKQLLGFARRGRYNVSRVDVAFVVEKTSAMFARTRKDLIVELDVAPGLAAVLMDDTQFEQVLLNLFLNAGQAMPDGGRLVLRAEDVELAAEVTDAHRVAPGHFVKITVADTGVGMDAATRARIFEPFFTTKALGHGTGLGLASVYGIIQGHAGFIEVESALGKGTTFTLFLPATDGRSADERAPAAAVQRGRGTVLVVDDEEPFAKICGRMLTQMGYLVLTASGGKQAIELVRERGDEIALVILDMVMPEMSGAQTYDALRQLAPGLKVLLSSGFSIEGHAQDLLGRGCNGFIQKPFDLSTLSAKVQEVL